MGLLYMVFKCNDTNDQTCTKQSQVALEGLESSEDIIHSFRFSLVIPTYSLYYYIYKKVNIYIYIFKL